MGGSSAISPTMGKRRLASSALRTAMTGLGCASHVAMSRNSGAVAVRSRRAPLMSMPRCGPFELLYRKICIVCGTPHPALWATFSRQEKDLDRHLLSALYLPRIMAMGVSHNAGHGTIATHALCWRLFSSGGNRCL